MSVCAFDPRVLESTLETLTVGIGDKTRCDRMTESRQGGADKNPGQEPALDGQGVQEFVLSRPHCCLFVFMSSQYSTPSDCAIDERNWTIEEGFDPPSAQHFLSLSVRLCHGLPFFVHSLRSSLRCIYFNWTMDCLFQT